MLHADELPDPERRVEQRLRLVHADLTDESALEECLGATLRTEAAVRAKQSRVCFVCVVGSRVSGVRCVL
jgi:hypothetical protein